VLIAIIGVVVLFWKWFGKLAALFSSRSRNPISGTCKLLAPSEGNPSSGVENLARLFGGAKPTA